MDHNSSPKKSNPAALLPIGVFLILYLGFGLVQSVYMRRAGVEGPRLHASRNLKIDFKKLK